MEQIDQSRPNLTKIDQIGPKLNEWTIVDQIGLNGLKCYADVSQ